MHKIIVISSFDEDTIHLKVKDLLKEQYASFSPRHHSYSESSYKNFLRDVQSPSLFVDASIYILIDVPLSSLKTLLSSLLELPFRPPVLLTTGYIKIADPLRKHLETQKEVSFLALKKPSDSYVSSKIGQLASAYAHSIEEPLLSYFLFLYKDSFSSIETDLVPFFLGTPASSSPLALRDFLQYRSSSFDMTYYLNKVLQKDFLFLFPLETLPSSDIIPFLRFLSFSFMRLLSPSKGFFSQLPSVWSTKDILKTLALFHSLEIQVKKSLFTSFNEFLETFQTMLLKQQ